MLVLFGAILLKITKLYYSNCNRKQVRLSVILLIILKTMVFDLINDLKWQTLDQRRDFYLATLMYHVPKLTHSSAPLFDQCDIQTRGKFWTVTMVYKTLKGLNPPYMSDMFKSVSEMSSLLTRSRQSNKLYVPRKNICVSRMSLRYSVV